MRIVKNLAVLSKQRDVQDSGGRNDESIGRIFMEWFRQLVRLYGDFGMQRNKPYSGVTQRNF